MKQRDTIIAHQQNIQNCTLCPDMIGPPITGNPSTAKILLVGQAPGDKEGAIGKPFAWTAGKTLFKWFDSIGISENNFRQQAYMAAVCRCFPGKNPKGGDRVPNKQEITTCSQWLEREVKLLQPDLLLPVGKLAISQFLEVKKLTDVIGQSFEKTVYGRKVQLIPLPHPSGASTWHRMEPGKSLLEDALTLISQHDCWLSIKENR